MRLFNVHHVTLSIIKLLIIKIKVFDKNSSLVEMFSLKLKRLKKINFIVNKSVKRDSLGICVNTF